MPKIKNNRTKNKTRFADKNKSNIPFADNISKGELSTHQKNINTSLAKGTSTALSGKRASSSGKLNVDTASASSTMRTIIDKVRASGQHDIIPNNNSDDEIFDYFANVHTTPVPPDPENLPAKISKDAVHLHGDYDLPDIDIYWHNVKDLPGYAIEQIRVMFRPLLKYLSGNQLEELKMAATTDGSTTFNTMKKAIAYISTYGNLVDEAEIDLPGLANYKVDKVLVYNLDDKVYIIAKETFQEQENLYIYEGNRKKDQIAGDVPHNPLLNNNPKN